MTSKKPNINLLLILFAHKPEETADHVTGLSILPPLRNFETFLGLLSSYNDSSVSDDSGKASILNHFSTLSDLLQNNNLTESLETHSKLINSINFSVDKLHTELFMY